MALPDVLATLANNKKKIPNPLNIFNNDRIR